MTDIQDTGTPSPLDALEAQSDDALAAIIGRAKALLGARKRDRQREAAAMIRRLARQHELDVSVARASRKRGRPPRA